MTNRNKLTEEDICLRYITPAIKKSGWKNNNIKREYFTGGRIMVRGNVSSRTRGKFADYLLSYISNLPLAIIEAKKAKYSVGHGIQQAIDYARILDIPFAYSSNGSGFVEYDFTTGKEKYIDINNFPSPEELWERYKNYKNIGNKQEDIIKEPYYYVPDGKIPRYYQRIAVNKTIEAISKGRKRLLLVMATGTGKTYTAFQIIWRLYKAKKIKKILFLADRNFLIDQTRIGDFSPLEDVMTKVQERTLNSAYEVHLSLYHQLVGKNGEEYFTQLSPNYFDLIIIDEAHRGSAREDSTWKKILNYFESSIQLGMTATPKETKTVSNIQYFGKPIYTYSLKQGIEDGFLAPYKVIRVGINKDLEGYRPPEGKRDIFGEEVEDREYNTKDYDKTLVIDKRTEVVAKRISDFLKQTDRFQKTIVFCVDTEHAARMRSALINENSDLNKENPNYIMRITGNDPLGKDQLYNFASVNSKYPVIAVTSQLLSTGLDVKMCKVIAIDKNIDSLIEFKQTIGRGTRIKEEDGKTFFTILDFREATKSFADPEFDGEPIIIKEIEEDQEIQDDNDPYDNTTREDFDNKDKEDENDKSPRRKYYIDGVYVTISNERVQYLDDDGKLITETIRDYSKKNILKNYATIDDFIKKWNQEDKKAVIISELEKEGVLIEDLKDNVGDDIDIFDLVLHVAYDKKPLTRKERAENVKKRGYLYKYSQAAQNVLNELLKKYQDEELLDFEDTKVLKLKPFDEMGGFVKILQTFGGKDEFIKAAQELKNNLYIS